MDAFEKGPLRSWKLQTRYDANGYRHHQRPAGSDCWKSVQYLGHGSFGEVRQERCVSGPSTNDLRAVKCLSKRESTFSVMSKRELNALVTFSNSHIPEYRNYFVQCLGWFDDTDHLYIAMEFLEHGDLQKYINKPFPEPEAALITAQVAQALQYMHRNNFVHRDIKPRNILVSYLGPQWHVKVADFGITKNIDGTSLETLQIGSLGYMAPELCANYSDTYTAAVDIWALGAVAFCIRTGFPPFRTIKHLLDYARDYKTHFPTRPLGTSSGFCMSFVLGTMAESPERRLTIEQVLAHDWLSLQLSISRRSELGIIAAGSRPISSVAPSNTWSHTRSSTSIQQPQPRPSSTPVLDQGLAPLPLRSFVSPSPSNSRPRARSSGESLNEDMENLAVSNINHEKREPSGADRTEELEKKVSIQQREILGEKQPGTSDTMAYFTAISDKQKMRGETEHVQVKSSVSGREMADHHEGPLLASGSDDRTIKIWDSTTGQCISSLKGHGDWIRSVAWSYDGRRLASGSDDKTVKIWDPTTGECISTLEGHGNWVRAVAWSYNNRSLASGSRDGAIKIWNPAIGQCISTLKDYNDWFKDHDFGIRPVAWSYDNLLLASGSDNPTVQIWDLSMYRHISTLKGHTDLVWSVAWSRRGLRLASGSRDKTVRIWNPATSRCIWTLKDHSDLVRSVAWSFDGRWLASGSDDKTVKIWDPDTGRCISTLKGHDSGVTSVDWSHDDRWLASGSRDKTVKVWNPETGQCISTLNDHGEQVKEHDFGITSVTWSPPGVTVQQLMHQRIAVEKKAHVSR